MFQARECDRRNWFPGNENAFGEGRIVRSYVDAVVLSGWASWIIRNFSDGGSSRRDETVFVSVARKAQHLLWYADFKNMISDLRGQGLPCQENWLRVNQRLLSIPKKNRLSFLRAWCTRDHNPHYNQTIKRERLTNSFPPWEFTARYLWLRISSLVPFTGNT